VEPATATRSPAQRKKTRKLVTAFSEISDRWEISLEDQLALLGHPARSTYFKWRKEGGILPFDTQQRLSYIDGIYKALQILFPSDESNNGWVRRSNKAAIFNGQTALEFMVRGGLPALHTVRTYLDAQRGGWA